MLQLTNFDYTVEYVGYKAARPLFDRSTTTELSLDSAKPLIAARM